jgi:hypothetical protein
MPGTCLRNGQGGQREGERERERETERESERERERERKRGLRPTWVSDYGLKMATSQVESRPRREARPAREAVQLYRPPVRGNRLFQETLKAATGTRPPERSASEAKGQPGAAHSATPGSILPVSHGRGAKEVDSDWESKRRTTHGKTGRRR